MSLDQYRVFSGRSAQADKETLPELENSLNDDLNQYKILSKAIPEKQKEDKRRQDYSGPRAGSLPAMLGLGDEENPQFNEAPIIPVGKSILRGIGTTVADVAKESRQGPKVGSLPYLLGFGQEEQPDYEWAAKLRNLLPEQSSDPALRMVERQARIASRPEMMIFGLPGFLGSMIMGTSGQAAEEVGFGPTGQAIAEMAPFGAAALSRIPQFSNMWKNFTKQQKADALTRGIVPSDLEPNQYKFFETEVVPELKQRAEQHYTEAKQAAESKLNQDYNQRLANVKAKHQNEMAAQEEAQLLQDEYKNELKRINDQFQKEKDAFDAQIKEFDLYKSRENAAQNALKSKGESVSDLSGRVSPQGPDVGMRPAPSVQIDPSLENKVLSDISSREFKNKTAGGETQADIIRAHAAIDYKNVNDLYKQAEELNSQINTIHPELAQDLQNTIRTIDEIPKPSPPQKQLRDTAEALLNKIAAVDSEGSISGFQPISNQTLLEQAKALRYYMDFEFAQANPKGIFTPTLRNIDNAVELAAVQEGNQAAIDSSRAARSAYREWSELYNNDYVNPFRNRSNFDFSKNFEKSLDVDNFRVIRRALDRSNIGSEVASTTERSLVQEHLGKYLENPLRTSVQDFNRALGEIEPIIGKDKASQIRNLYLADKKGSGIRARPGTRLAEPKPPKPEKAPKAPPKPKEIEAVTIPLKPELKPSPEMSIAAQKMKITPEQAMKLSDTPTGLKELRANTSKDVFERIGKQKIKDMLFKGEIKGRPTGAQLFEVANKGDNFAIMSEIMGEEAAADFLNAAEKVGSKSLTAENLKPFLKKYTVIKVLLTLGLI